MVNCDLSAQQNIFCYYRKKSKNTSKNDLLVNFLISFSIIMRLYTKKTLNLRLNVLKNIIYGEQTVKSNKGNAR